VMKSNLSWKLKSSKKIKQRKSKVNLASLLSLGEG
jgi:hypothetical protein